MTLRSASVWGLSAVAATVVSLTAAGLWLMRRKRPAADELERARRRFLAQSGRLVDGMLLEVAEVDGADGHKLTMLIYNYRVGRVDYDCSQDITALGAMLDVKQVRSGFPCTVRYQPDNAQNSIVVTEQWSGLRAGLPLFPVFDDRRRLDLGQLRPRLGKPRMEFDSDPG